MKSIKSITLFAMTFICFSASAGLFDWWGKGESFQGILVSKTVNAEQTKSILEDLKFVNDLKLNEELDAKTKEEVLRVLKIKLDSKNIGLDLFAWLKARVSYIVGEDYELEKNIKIVRQSQTYPATGEPKLEKPTKNPESSSGTVQTVMANIGAALYFVGRQANTLLGLKIDGDTVAITSPRSGIIKVGSGLFGVTKRTKDLDANSIVKRLARIETFFHESRHSDGRGSSLGFFHAICPKGHEYEGYAACDRNLNGPYTVGAVMLKVLKSACVSTLKCSEVELTRLDLSIADSENRVIKTEKNPANERVISQINGFKTIYEVCKKVPELSTCNELAEKMKDQGISPDDFDRILREGLPPVSNKDWDDEPEGV